MKVLFTTFGVLATDMTIVSSDTMDLRWDGLLMYGPVASVNTYNTDTAYWFYLVHGCDFAQYSCFFLGLREGVIYNKVVHETWDFNSENMNVDMIYADSFKITPMHCM